MKLPWKKKKSSRYIALETRLDAILQPIMPRPEFVAALRAQLVGEPAKQGVSLNNEKVQIGLVVLAFLLGGYMLLINGVRVVLTIVGTLGLLQLKKQVDEQPVKPSTPAF